MGLKPPVIHAEEPFKSIFKRALAKDVARAEEEEARAA
jgi:hypothetical protein